MVGRMDALIESDASAPITITSVGGLVTHGERLLLGRMAYSPTRGQYMLPGGVVEPGETLDVAIVREVREETGITARPIGIVGVDSIVYLGDTHTYIVWLLEAESGDLAPDGVELEDCCFLAFDEIAERPDVSYLVKFYAKKLRDDALTMHRRAPDYEQYVGELGPETYRVFV